jgi:hypothetical protein
MKRVTTGAIVLAIVAQVGASAQARIVRYGDDRLTGIREVDVLVTSAAEADSCGVSRGATQQRMVHALHAAGLKATISERGRSWYHSIVVHLETGATRSSCVTAITTELVSEVRAIPEADDLAPSGAWGSLLAGPMTLVRDNALVITRSLEHDAAVQQAVERHVTAIAARVRTVNR